MMIRELNLEWMDSAKAHFGIDDDPCLLFVGQMNWKKNILKILEACSILKKEGIAFNLIMAGKGPHEDEIKDKVKKLGIEEDTYIVGHVLREDLLNGLYMLADLFVPVDLRQRSDGRQGSGECGNSFDRRKRLFGSGRHRRYGEWLLLRRRFRKYCTGHQKGLCRSGKDGNDRPGGKGDDSGCLG